MLKLPVIFLFIVLSFLVEAFLFGGPEGKLLPNNPVVCTTQSITLTCTVERVEYTSADLRFSINDSPVPENETAVVDNSSRSLTFTNVTFDDFNANILCCLVSCNQPNHILEGQLLEVYDYPVGVVNFSCIRYAWEKRMNCTWSLAQKYKRLPNVTVQWRIPSSSASWTPLLVSESREESIWHNGGFAHRNIQVQVNVISQCGITIENIFDVNTTNIVKPRAIPGMQVRPLTSSCVNVTWNYNISPEYWKQYKIELHSNWKDPFEPYYRNNTKDTKFEHVFCDLVPNTEYTILGWVKPMTEGFWSDVKTAKATTPKDVPFASPVVTQGGYKWDPSDCETKDRRTVYFYYKPIPKRHENGVMTEITATSDFLFYHNSVPTNKTSVPAHHTQMSVELNCYHDYSFEITAVNEKGAGDRWSRFNIPRVRHDTKIPKVIVETTGKFTYLNWTVDPVVEPSGFTVFWCKRDRGNCNNTVPVQWQTVSGKRNTVTLNISAPEEFLYSVSMETKQGSTGMFWESCIYAMHAEPKQSTDSPTVSTTPEDNTLSVYWNRIECVSGSPYFPLYKVVYCEWNADTTNCSAFSEEIIVPSTQTSVVIEGLKEDVKYGVMVQGVTADGQEGPVSEPAFGVPENNSLKPGHIGLISIGCLMGLVFITAGAIAIIRYCNKKRKVLMKGPEIADIPITKDDEEEKKSTPNGCINQNYSDQSLSEVWQTTSPVSKPYTQGNGYVTPNDVFNNMLQRAKRQNSVDSGYPEDPMTPRPTGDPISFPEPIEEMASQQSLEAFESSDGKKIATGWRILPSGYCRVNTEDDGIPRTATYPEINNESEGQGQNNFGSPLSDYLDLALVTNQSNIHIVPQNELVIFTAQTSVSETISTSVTEPMSSYTKVHYISEGNSIVEKAEKEGQNIPQSETHTHSIESTTVINSTITTVANSSANGYVTHPSANTPIIIFANSSANGFVTHHLANTQITSAANSSANGYVAHPLANTQTTTVTNSSANGYITHPSATTPITSVANSSANGYIAHSLANTPIASAANFSANGYVTHPLASTQITSVANSSANGYVTHPLASTQITSANGYVTHPLASTQITRVENSSANGYVAHPSATTQITSAANSSANGYVAHQLANTPMTSVANSSANGTIAHSSATTQITSAANSSAKGYVTDPLANTPMTSVTNSSANGYIAHPSATTQITSVANSNANGYVTQPLANTPITTVANSSANGYVAHPLANKIMTPDSNSSSNFYVPNPLENTPIAAKVSANGYVANTLVNTPTASLVNT